MTENADLYERFLTCLGFELEPEEETMTESLHAIVRHYLPHSDADDLCQDITGWLKRNYRHHKDRPLIDRIREDIWKSCEEADKVT